MCFSRRFLYLMFYATLGCATLTASLYGEELNLRRFKLSEPHGKFQIVLSPFSWLNIETDQGIDLLREICTAVESNKSICLMSDPGAFSFNEVELEWIWKHFSVLSISEQNMRSLISFDEKKENAELIPSVCLISMEASRDDSTIRIISVEHFSRKEVHEFYSNALFIEEMNLFLRGAPLPNVFSPVPRNDLSKHQKVEKDFKLANKNIVSFRETQFPTVSSISKKNP